MFTPAPIPLFRRLKSEMFSAVELCLLDLCICTFESDSDNLKKGNFDRILSWGDDRVELDADLKVLQ